MLAHRFLALVRMHVLLAVSFMRVYRGAAAVQCTRVSDIVGVRDFVRDVARRCLALERSTTTTIRMSSTTTVIAANPRATEVACAIMVGACNTTRLAQHACALKSMRTVHNLVTSIKRTGCTKDHTIAVHRSDPLHNTI